MKKKVLLIILFISSLAIQAQNIGINNNDPQTALDVQGQLRIRPVNATVTGSSLTLSDGTAGYIVINGSPATDFTIILPSATAGSFLLLENTTFKNCIITGLVQISAGKSRLLLRGNSDWVLASYSESQLELLNSSFGNGWRLLDRNASNYGTIGANAVDLSFSSAPSSILGATGNNSVALGFATRASALYSLATGSNTVSSGISSVAFGSNTESSGQASSSFGYSTIASGTYSTAFGEITKATNFSSFATGYNTLASSQSSSAFGGSTVASGEFSTSFGVVTKATSLASISLGQYNDTVAGANPNFWVATDPLLMLGNGTSNVNRSNAATFYKNGNADLNGFVRLGKESEAAPRIKMKVLTTTVNGVGTGSIPHGLTESKILNLSVKIVNQFNSVVFDGNNIANNSFNAYINAGSVIVQGVAGSFGDLIGRTATIVITYQE